MTRKEARMGGMIRATCRSFRLSFARILSLVPVPLRVPLRETSVRCEEANNRHEERGADIRLMIGGLVLSLVTLSPCLLPSPRHSLVPRSCREDWRKNDDKVNGKGMR